MNTKASIESDNLENYLDAKLLSFEGDLDSTNADLFIDKINQIINQGFNKFVADLGKLRYINSVGIGVLLHFHNTSRQREGCFKLANVSPNVMEIISIIGANNFLEIYPTVKAAVKSLSMIKH